ncbi:MAG: cyclic nucleotide-binding domain-containing protein [Exilispira sp.]|nr:cyclic nucleotide-binding domain-containing protein [Exilispira sp.]
MQKIKSLTELDGVITSLPRGGYLVNTSIGYIQFGSPPETLKDTIFLPLGVPKIFILPMEHFDPKQGMSVAEIEFPIYYNFFLKKAKTKVYVSRDHIKNMEIVLNEAVFGPKDVDVKDEVVMIENAYVPDLKSEMEFFRNNRKLEDMVELLPLEQTIKIQNVTIKRNNDGSFEVFDDGKHLVNVPAKIKFSAVYDLGAILKEPFHPPIFGITCLGPSHGFDPYQNTSGFIIWINKGGIMVDPPANSTLWLKDSNVNSKLIDSVILTHCHADHDSGTFQKILEETRITIYTTPTVMASFIRKYSALTRISPNKLREMFNFYPVKMNQQYNIHGAIFSFFYTLHSIPTIGFQFNYRNKTFIYSSDHLNEPNIIKELYEKGIISEKRYKTLVNFPWDKDIIYHEAGIPPLHTPVSYLNSLPVEIQKKITVYHIAEKDFPKETHLKLAKFGIGETFYPDIEKHRFEEAYQILDVFSRIDIFKDLPFERVKDLLLIVKKVNFKKNDFIIKKNSDPDYFYVIVSGNVSIAGLKDNNIKDKIYTTFEYFGEAAILNNEKRKADVVALTSVEAYAIDKTSFLKLIQDTPIEIKMRQVAKVRDELSWKVIKANEFFQDLSSSQITQLEGMSKIKEIKKGETIFSKGEYQKSIYLLIEGTAQTTDGNIIENMGDFIGEICNLYEDKPINTEYKAKTNLKVYEIEAEKIKGFLKENPGITMNILFSKSDKCSF